MSLHHVRVGRERGEDGAHVVDGPAAPRLAGVGPALDLLCEAPQVAAVGVGSV